MHYDIAGLYAKYPVIHATCTNGTITIEKDKPLSDTVWIFIDGRKIADSAIRRTNTGFTITKKLSGDAIIYNLQSTIFEQKITKAINTNSITIKGSTREQLLVFIDGEFVWDSCEYDITTGLLRLPKSTGALELYKIISNQNLYVRHYYVENNPIDYLYVELPLRNILVNSDDPKLSEMIRFLKFHTFQFPHTADEQSYDKTYGTTEQIGN